MLENARGPAREVQGQGQIKSKRSRWPVLHIIGSIVLVLAALALMLPMAGLAGAALYVRQIQMVLPGVRVGPVDVSNLALTEAATAIDNYWNNTAHFLVLNEDYQWTVTPPNIGLWVDSAVQSLILHNLSDLACLVVVNFYSHHFGYAPIPFIRIS